MAIGEFGGAAAAPSAGAGSARCMPRRPIGSTKWATPRSIPARAFADAGKLFFKNPANPWSHTELGKTAAAAYEMFERSTRRYGKPEWNVTSTLIGAERVPVHDLVGLGAAVLPPLAFRARLRRIRRGARSRSF